MILFPSPKHSFKQNYYTLTERKNMKVSGNFCYPSQNLFPIIVIQFYLLINVHLQVTQFSGQISFSNKRNWPLLPLSESKYDCHTHHHMFWVMSWGFSKQSELGRKAKRGGRGRGHVTFSNNRSVGNDVVK